MTGSNSVKREVTTPGAKSSDGAKAASKRSRSEAQSDNVSVVLDKWDDVQRDPRRPHPASTSAMMPSTPLSVDRTALGCYSPTRMEERSEGERRYYKVVYEDALDFEKAGEKVSASATKLANQRAERKAKEAREAEIRKHREAFEEQQRKEGKK